jgi:hypothetical protein
MPIADGNEEAADGKQKKLENVITIPCLNVICPIRHQSWPIAAKVFLVLPSGGTQIIAEGITCGWNGWDEKKENKYACEMVPHSLSKYREWPSDLGRIWTILAERGPAYWMEWGWHITRLKDGRLINFNDTVSVPPFMRVEELTTEAKRNLTFRAVHDPALPEEIRKLFGKYDAAKAEQLKQGLVSYAESMPEDELGEEVPF